MEKEFEFRGKRKTLDDWIKEIHEECVIMYGENRDGFNEEYRKRCGILMEEYEAALSQAIKSGEWIGDKHIAAIRECELCGWNWDSDEIRHYDLEKSVEAKIMVVQIDDELYGINGYYSPYWGFDATDHVFRPVKKVEKVIVEYEF